MGVFDKIKKKTEGLTAGAGDWASKTIKNSSEWTSNTAKDLTENRRYYGKRFRRDKLAILIAGRKK